MSTALMERTCNGQLFLRMPDCFTVAGKARAGAHPAPPTIQSQDECQRPEQDALERADDESDTTTPVVELSPISFVDSETLIEEVVADVNRRSSGATRPASAYVQSDAGNTDYFIDHCRGWIRYDHTRGRWMIYRNHRWEPDLTSRALHYAQAIARKRTLEAVSLPDGKQASDPASIARQVALKWALLSEKLSRIQATLTIAASDPRIGVTTASGWDDRPFLLGAPNGVIDLRTGQLRDGVPTDQITKQVGVAYDPKAVCPRFERFLSEIFCDNEQLVAYVRRAIGYTLTGSVDEDCWFGCYGTGRNGKSTLFNVLYGVLGDYAYVASFSLVERNKNDSRRDFDIAYLQQKRFVQASETREGGTWDEERLKRLTGRDPLHAEIKFGSEFHFRPMHKLWFMFNHRPRTQDHSIGFWRRVRLIPFDRQFAGDEADKHLDAKLRAEYPGILAWAVRACIEYQREGLPVPQAIIDASAQYEQDEDPLLGYIEKHVKTDSAGPGFKLKEAYKFYELWCADESIKNPLGKHRFANLLEERLKPRGIVRVRKDGAPYFRPGKLAYMCTCMQKPCTCV